MMNNDMLANIEYLREKADVSYEEAERLLEQHDGNVMRVLVELEQQGRVYAQPHGGHDRTSEQQHRDNFDEAKEKATSFINKAFQTHLVVERKNENGEKETVANLNLPFAAGVTIVAPWLTLATAGIAAVTGHSVKIEKEKTEDQNA